jgi:hypothetical protein
MDSKGHLFNTTNFEYFTDGTNIYRSPVDCPIDVNGFKMGARFECPDTEHFRKMLQNISVLIKV